MQDKVRCVWRTFALKKVPRILRQVNRVSYNRVSYCEKNANTTGLNCMDLLPEGTYHMIEVSSNGRNNVQPTHQDLELTILHLVICKSTFMARLG